MQCLSIGLQKQSTVSQETSTGTTGKNELKMKDLVKELDAGASYDKMSSGGLLQKIEDWQIYLTILAGATLLTSWERVLFGLVVGAIVVLVSVGMLHAASFYARMLAQKVALFL